MRDELHHAIVTGALKPGERLRAEALARRFGTSRTPVREALLGLEADGLVEVEPRRGAVVRAFDPADLAHLYELRAVIEPYAAARAARHIEPAQLARLEELCREAEARGAASAEAIDDQIALNEEFHRVVLEAASSPRLAAAMRAVSGIPRAFRTVFWRSDELRGHSLFCHRELVRALGHGHPELAESVMRTHVLSAREFLLEVVDGGR